MRTLVIGIDSGTQSTKALVVDVKDGKVLAAATESYDLIEGLPAGAKEQNPSDWIEAVRKSIQRAMAESGALGIGDMVRQHMQAGMIKSEHGE